VVPLLATVRQWLHWLKWNISYRRSIWSRIFVDWGAHCSECFYLLLRGPYQHHRLLFVLSITLFH